MWAAMALVLSFVPVDVLLGVWSWRMGLVRLVTLLAFGVLTWANRRLSAPGARLVRIFGAALGAMSAVAVAVAAGGYAGPYTAFLYLVPMVVTVVGGADLVAVLPAAAVVGASTIAMAYQSRGQWKDVVPALAFQVVSTGLALMGCLLIRRVRAAELDAAGARTEYALLQLEAERARERAEAAERLAQSERLRVQSESLATLGRLAAGVGHEIRNPLTYLKANLAYLAEELPRDNSELRDALRDAQSGVEHVATIVDELKTFARQEESATEGCDVVAAVDETLRMARFRTRGLIQLTRKVEGSPARVRMPRRRLVQVVLNLLVNAVDALEGASCGRPPSVEVLLRASEQGVEVVVTDNGPGLEAPVLARLWEPFFTTKPEGRGLGLGLCLSREYLQQCGGTIQAGNAPSGGAQFRIQLPLA